VLPLLQDVAQHSGKDALRVIAVVRGRRHRGALGLWRRRRQRYQTADCRNLHVIECDLAGTVGDANQVKRHNLYGIGESERERLVGLRADERLAVRDTSVCRKNHLYVKLFPEWLVCRDRVSHAARHAAALGVYHNPVI